MDGRVRHREAALEEDIIIRFDGVTKAFGKDVVLQDINLAYLVACLRQQPSYVVSRLAETYVEVIRNIPSVINGTADGGSQQGAGSPMRWSVIWDYREALLSGLAFTLAITVLRG